jgi:general secretion pathway protein J
MRQSTSSPRRAAGFTLVEVIVALAIFALLVSVMYGALSGVTRAYDAAEEAVEQGSRERIGIGFITSLLERAYPLALADGSSWIARFHGESGRLGFVADLPGYVGQAGMHEVWLQVGEREGAPALWLLWRPMMIDADAEEVTGEYQERVLIEDIKALQARYYGASGDEADAQWQEEWIGQQRIPSLIELTLVDAGEKDWPVLRIRPRANALRYLSVRRGGAGSAGPSAAPQPPGVEPDEASVQEPASADPMARRLRQVAPQ